MISIPNHVTVTSYTISMSLKIFLVFEFIQVMKTVEGQTQRKININTLPNFGFPIIFFFRSDEYFIHIFHPYIDSKNI